MKTVFKNIWEKTKGTPKYVTNNYKKFRKTESHEKIINSLIAIGVGILIGFLIMVLIKPLNSLDGLWKLLTGGLALGRQSIGNVLQEAAPLIFTGLAFAFAAKTGLFNIGGSGQFMVGGIIGLYVAELMKLPPVIHFIVAVIASVLAAGIWGAIAGVLKAFFNVSEVISTIMLNYIGMYFAVMLASNPKVFNSSINAVDISHPTANTPILGLNKLFPYSYIDISIFIAVLIAILIWFVLNKTTTGYQLKAVGYSTDGSKYAGIPYKRNIILSMFIAGGLAGFGAAFAYLAKEPTSFEVATIIVSQGFDGLSVALIANNNPIGIIFSGVFVSYLKQGAGNIQLAGFNSELANIITAAIIYMSALSSFLGVLIKRIKNKNSDETNLDENQVRQVEPQ